MQKPKRTKTSYRRRIFIALAVFSTLCLAFIGISLTILISSLSRLGTPQSFILDDHGCLDAEPYLISKIESMAEFKLPTSAENLFADSIAFQDCVVFVSFEMNHTDLSTLLDSTYIENLEPHMGNELTEVKGYLQNNLTDWTFDDDKTYLYGKGQHPEGLETQWIVVDEISRTLLKAYIVTVLL